MDNIEKTVTGAQPVAGAKGSNLESAKSKRTRETLVLYLAISLGGIIGSVLRALSSLAALALAGDGFPWGTLFVNVVGSFVIGFYAAATGPGGRMFASTYQRQFVMTGICGGFTTFSTFSLEAFLLLESGRYLLAGCYIAISMVCSLAFAWAGHALSSRFNRLGGI